MYDSKLQKNKDKTILQVGKVYQVKSNYRETPFTDLDLNEEGEDTKFNCKIMEDCGRFYIVKVLTNDYVLRSIMITISKHNLLCEVVKVKLLD